MSELNVKAEEATSLVKMFTQNMQRPLVSQLMLRQNKQRP
jgi:hypothetical protein